MSNVVVYVFLLDNLVGFKSALNETVVKNTPSLYKNFTPVIRQCDTTTTNQILNVVTKELDMEIMPTVKTVDKFAMTLNDALNDASQNALYNVLLESSIPIDDEKDESKPPSLEHDSGENYRRKFNFENVANIKNILEGRHNENMTNLTEEDEKRKENEKTYVEEQEHIKEYTEKLAHTDEHNLNTNNINTTITETNTTQEILRNVTEVDRNATSMESVGFPRSAPFLVAIFETLANVTAQTCAGTLIAPNWVLTGANCVNILSNLYANDTTMADSETLYTVVAGAIDPLSDGSAHNVTAVLQHHSFSENSTRNRKSIHVEIGPYLAMMQIEPEFEGVGLPLVEEKIKKGDVMIYGWILTKSESGLDTLNLVIMSALILSTAECQAMYSFNNNDVICLFNNDSENNITELSSGGPVLIVHGGEPKLMAVAQTDEHVFIAYPIYVHYNWIKSILNNYK